MNPCFLSSETFDQHPDSVDPVFDQSEWPEGTEIFGTYNTSGQRVRYVGRDELPLALAYDAAGLDAYLLYGGQFTPSQAAPNASLGYLSIPWYLITGFDIQNWGFPPFYDDWVALPEFSNTINTTTKPDVEIIQFGVVIEDAPSATVDYEYEYEVFHYPFGIEDYEEGVVEFTTTTTCQLTDDGFGVEFVTTDIPDEVEGVPIPPSGWVGPPNQQGSLFYSTTGSSITSNDSIPQSTVDPIALQSIANQRAEFLSSGINPSPVANSVDGRGTGWGGTIRLENAYTLLRNSYDLIVTDYNLQARLGDFGWQGQWTQVLSVTEWEIDDTLRDLDFLGTKEYGWKMLDIDFDITTSTNLRTIPTDPTQQEFFIDLTPDKIQLGDLENVQLGWREDVPNGLDYYLNYPSLGIDAPALQGVYPADFLDFNAIIPSAAYTAMIPPPP